MATFTQNPPKYDAVQWTDDGDPEAFAAVADPTNVGIWTVNDDGSLQMDYFGNLFEIPVDGWIASVPYWIAVNWSILLWTPSPDGNIFFTADQFAVQFTEV